MIGSVVDGPTIAVLFSKNAHRTVLLEELVGDADVFLQLRNPMQPGECNSLSSPGFVEPWSLKSLSGAHVIHQMWPDEFHPTSAGWTLMLSKHERSPGTSEKVSSSCVE